ncbi:MAG: glycosyltransferase [Atopobiaceae bacterium]|nr:glycosyltransferase [Atopobiaceae bacterium]
MSRAESGPQGPSPELHPLAPPLDLAPQGPSPERRPPTPPDLSIVMPCLDEEATVGACIEDARGFIVRRGLSGEVIVVDNGSTDRSAEVARRHGADVVSEPRRGYGRALRTGLAHARGRVIVMGDSDTTYDFANTDALVAPLLAGEVDLMVGDRFAGMMEKGAMPFLHRLGVPFLSWCGRMRWHVDVHDFHCGLRGITREALGRCRFRADGMEFATEMIAETTRKGLRIGQVAVALRCGPRGRKPKLRTFSDGWRHLRYILFSSE